MVGAHRPGIASLRIHPPPSVGHTLRHWEAPLHHKHDQDGQPHKLAAPGAPRRPRRNAPMPVNPCQGSRHPAAKKSPNGLRSPLPQLTTPGCIGCLLGPRRRLPPCQSAAGLAGAGSLAHPRPRRDLLPGHTPDTDEIPISSRLPSLKASQRLEQPVISERS